jgi:putative membrane protein
MKHLLSEAEAAQVAEHVARAERGTAGEIVVVLAESSSGYERERAGVSFVLTLGSAVLAYSLAPQISGLWILCGQAPAMVLAWWLTGWAPLLRALVPSRLQAQAVKARAEQLFIEQGVTETRERSGVLLYLSEIEHRVELLADRGIHERVGAETWRQLVDAVVKEIRMGHAAAGIIAAVDAIGARLAQHFPPSPGDVNELSDAPRRI